MLSRNKDTGTLWRLLPAIEDHETPQILDEPQKYMYNGLITKHLHRCFAVIGLGVLAYFKSFFSCSFSVVIAYYPVSVDNFYGYILPQLSTEVKKVYLKINDISFAFP